MEALAGYRTYIVAGLLVLTGFCLMQGWIDDRTFNSVLALLLGGGVATQRLATANVEAKVETLPAIQAQAERTEERVADIQAAVKP